ncbi:GtrA family protein [Rhizobium sp. LCM 4573]|uniref:GtrA family protein n=1 Tax=Rhizobium sp. LCM 4573 TaxID=1848291 RepID=UPI0008DA0BF1|nr:GtrA family protein [Rhizobium sp. LCM 4573]OHV84996.1 hypothetical protein LCM4573_04985 [Rhizobium sp. LCM 4573]
MSAAKQILPMRDLMKLAEQLSRFGLVGLAATCVHLLVFSLVIDLANLEPSLANVVGFLAAFILSFAGQSSWTFPSKSIDRPQRRRRFLRYIAVSLTGFLMNAAVVHVVVDVLAYPYTYALPIMGVGVPAILFALNKYWAFADIRKE